MLCDISASRNASIAKATVLAAVKRVEVVMVHTSVCAVSRSGVVSIMTAKTQVRQELEGSLCEHRFYFFFSKLKNGHATSSCFLVLSDGVSDSQYSTRRMPLLPIVANKKVALSALGENLLRKVVKK